MPARRPLAIARRVGLFDRKVTLSLGQTALDQLFEAADVLSEGERRGPGYLGSTMITLDVARVAEQIRERADGLAAREVASLLTGDLRVRARARELALADASERAAVRIGRAQLEFRARAVGTRVHLDVDVEAELAAAEAAR